MIEFNEPLHLLKQSCGRGLASNNLTAIDRDGNCLTCGIDTVQWIDSQFDPRPVSSIAFSRNEDSVIDTGYVLAKRSYFPE